MTDLQREIEKLKFQMLEMHNCLENPSRVLTMLIEFNWGREELQRAESIMKKYEPLSRDPHCRAWASDLRREFEDELGVLHQGMKTVIGTFFYGAYILRLTLDLERREVIS